HRNQKGREHTEAAHQVSCRENEYGQRDRIAQSHGGDEASGELKMLHDRRQGQCDNGPIQGRKKEREANGTDGQPPTVVAHHDSSALWTTIFCRGVRLIPETRRLESTRKTHAK